MDFDRDGLLDLIVACYVDWDFENNPWCGEHKPGYRSYCHPDNFKALSSLVYHNNGDGTFSDVSEKAGFAATPGKGLGIAFNDFDRDGWFDIVVANDEFPQQLFKNNGNGTFTEMGKLQGLAFDEDGRVYAGMGIDLQDYDNDGWTDVFINALSNQKYALYRNTKDAFEYLSGPSGIAGITLLRSGWGAKFIDYDNDGWKDLFVAQGHVMDNIELTQPSFRYLEPLLLMRNAKGKFQDVSKQSGPAFQVLRAGRGAAFGDLDNDGNLDVVINCNNQEAVILRNQGGTHNNWLIINTVGTASNRDGIGARVHLVGESGLEQYGLVSTAGSYLSASDKRVHFGLGGDKTVRLLEIIWPNGSVQRLVGIQANQILRVEEPKEK
jgi:enediyne biosynthesis protein E4